MSREGSRLQEELIRLLSPPVPQRAGLVSEQIAPLLAEVGRTSRGRPADEVFARLEQVVVAAGARPDHPSLREFAEQIEAGENPFE